MSPVLYNQLGAMHGTIIANNTRKPLWGYRLMVYSIFALGFLSFIVWAHHMFLTGMGTAISAFFRRPRSSFRFRP